MSSVLEIPSSAFSFSLAGTVGVEAVVQTVKPVKTADPVDVEARLRKELQEEFDLRLAKEIEQHDRQLRERHDALFRDCSARFDGVIDSLRREIQEKVVDLSLELTEVIVRHELPDRDMLKGLITKTLAPVSDLQGAVVRVCPQDHELLGDRVLSDLHGMQNAVEFVSDAQLCLGDVIVESRNGIFDARLDERLKLLKETLHERSGRKEESPSET